MSAVQRNRPEIEKSPNVMARKVAAAVVHFGLPQEYNCFKNDQKQVRVNISRA